MKLDERILRVFSIGVFVGVRKRGQNIHTAFFIDDKQAEPADLELLAKAIRAVPVQVRKALRDVLRSKGTQKKRKRRKKNPT